MNQIQQQIKNHLNKNELAKAYALADKEQYSIKVIDDQEVIKPIHYYKAGGTA